MINGHGDDLHQFPAIRANFSSNVALGGTHSVLLEHLQKNLASIKHYPPPSNVALEKKAADFHGVSPLQITMTAGATDAFYTLAKHFSKRFQNPRAVVVSPTFSEYEDACHACNIPVNHIIFDRLLKGGTTAQICFICNPNNPDGRLIEATILKAIIKKHPETFFIVDEAYMDFAPENCSLVKYITHYKNLIIIKSLTKIFSIAGIRLGYFITHPNFNFYKNQMPWKLGVIPHMAGVFIFEHWQSILPDIAHHLKLSLDLQKAVQKLNGFEVVFSKLHYFLVKLQTPCSQHLKSLLAHQYGILIRDAQNFHGMDAHYIRICAREKEKNEALLSAFSKWNF